MWDVVRFAEYHRYPIVICENVVEATKWAPFRAWLQAMDSLGYDHEIICHNSMHSHLGGIPAPQSRDRLYVTFWLKKMKRPAWEKAQTPLAFCEKCDKVIHAVKSWKKPGNTVGKYRSQYLYACPSCASYVEPAYMPASTAIDWSIEGTRIGDRTKPLSEKTMRRIRAGLERWGQQATVMRNASTRDGAGMSHLSTPVTEVMRTILADGIPQSLINPSFLLAAHGHTWDSADPTHPNFGDPNGYMRAWPTSEPMRTLTASATTGIVTMPLLVPVEGREGKQARSVDEALRTVTCRNETALLVPYYGRENTATPVDQSMPTVTTEPRHGLVILRGNNTIKPVSIPDIDDCMFRMLEPSEYAAGMAFPRSYIWEGTKREKVKMAGNAVTPPMARDLGIVSKETLEAAA
jgi:DNA (cytosine-5)-methyltransferase 1